jgi:predicted lysophospholipase L1 biosynthesis ABC-type transport system permease subunit
MKFLRFRAAWKIAWRDLRSGRRHFVVAVASLAVGVAAMNASCALGSEFARRLNGDMRHWIAAAAVTLRQPPFSAGRWWRPGAAALETVVSESLAGMLGANVGQTLEFFSNGRAISARIVGPRRLDAIE